MAVLHFVLTLIKVMLLSSVPALGFAMLFNVPKNELKYCALLGAIGQGFFFSLKSTGLGEVAAAFLASCVVGVFGFIIANWRVVPPKILTVAAVIPMFPGIHAYTAMLVTIRLSEHGYDRNLFEMQVTHFLHAIFVVGALSIGLSLPGLWMHRKHPRT